MGTDHIELTRLRPARPTAEAAEALGRGLAVTHGEGATAFGSPPPGWTGDAWIGRQPQTNEPPVVMLKIAPPGAPVFCGVRAASEGGAVQKTVAARCARSHPATGDQ